MAHAGGLRCGDRRGLLLDAITDRVRTHDEELLDALQRRLDGRWIGEVGGADRRSARGEVVELRRRPGEEDDLRGSTRSRRSSAVRRPRLPEAPEMAMVMREVLCSR